MKINYEKMGSPDATYGLLNINEFKSQILPIHCMCKNILLNLPTVMVIQNDCLQYKVFSSLQY